MTPSQSALFTAMLSEVDRARAKHGPSVEQGSNGDRCRILMAEVFEVSKAIDALDAARDDYSENKRHMTTAELETNRESRRQCREDIRAEVLQCMAVCWRWLCSEEASRG